jgi:hypothetical protein
MTDSSGCGLTPISQHPLVIPVFLVAKKHPDERITSSYSRSSVRVRIERSGLVVRASIGCAGIGREAADVAWDGTAIAVE